MSNSYRVWEWPLLAAACAFLLLCSAPALAQSDEEQQEQQQEEEQGLEELLEIPDIEEEPAPPAEEPAPQPAAEEPAALPAEETKQPAPRKEEETKGVYLFNKKVRVRGILQARAAQTGSDVSVFTRYTTDDGGSQVVFDVPYAALAFTADFNQAWRAHLHLGYSHSLDDGTTNREHYDSRNSLEVYEAFVQYALRSDYFKQPFYVRLGRIAPINMSLAHRGPLRTATWFSIPSPISTFLNNIYGYGLDVRYGFEEGKNPIGAFAAGILEGNDAYALPYDPVVTKHYWPVTDIMTSPHGDNADFHVRDAFYAYATVRDATERLRGHIAYYTNGVQRSHGTGATLRVAMGGLDADLWGRGELQFQMLNGETLFRDPMVIFGTPVIAPMLKFDGFFVAVSIPFAKHHRASFRYDEFSINYSDPNFMPETSLAYTANYSYTFKGHHRLSAEYIKIDTQEWNPAGTDISDDMTLVTYTFFF